MGKVSLRREKLAGYQGRDHWFPLTPVDADSEVQGKVQIHVARDSARHTFTVKWVPVERNLTFL